MVPIVDPLRAGCKFTNEVGPCPIAAFRGPASDLRARRSAPARPPRRAHRRGGARSWHGPARRTLRAARLGQDHQRPRVGTTAGRRGPQGDHFVAGRSLPAAAGAADAGGQGASAADHPRRAGHPRGRAWDRSAGQPRQPRPDAHAPLRQGERRSPAHQPVDGDGRALRRHPVRRLVRGREAASPGCPAPAGERPGAQPGPGPGSGAPMRTRHWPAPIRGCSPTSACWSCSRSRASTSCSAGAKSRNTSCQSRE